MDRTREDLAWAAGLFEGEGCFTTSRRGRFQCAKVSMTDADVVERFNAIIGFGSLTNLRLSQKNPKWKDQRCWTVSNFEGFQAVVVMLWPWLGERRRARAIEVLQRVAQAKAADPPLRRLRTRCPSGHPYDEVNTYRDPRGSRHCRTCRRASVAAYFARLGQRPKAEVDWSANTRKAWITRREKYGPSGSRGDRRTSRQVALSL